MKLKNKKILAALAALIVVALYPLSSSGKQTEANSSSDTTNIILNKDNLVVLNNEINDQTVAETIQSLMKLDSSSYFKKDKPIYLFLYSPGGSIQSGLELIDAVHGLHRKVNTLTSFSASMAFQLVQNLGERDILPNGVLMSHRAAGEFSGYFGGKSPSQLDSRYALWLHRMDELDQQTVKRTNGKQTLESYRESYRDEMWLTGSESVKQGYADKIATVSCDKTLSGTTPHTTDFMGLEFQYETADCPLITGLLNIKVIEPNGKAISPIVVDTIKQKFIDQFDLEKNIR